jgi:hypothetical protein
MGDSPQRVEVFPDEIFIDQERNLKGLPCKQNLMKATQSD